MAATSAGLLLHRRGVDGAVEVLLVHPGGPLWASKDEGAWSVPKGEHTSDEDALACARREFAEELGLPAPEGPFTPLGTRAQSSRKRVTVFAVAADLDPSAIVPGTFPLEWPPRSGRTIDVPEVDRAEWFSVPDARTRLHPGQVPFLDDLLAHLGHPGDPPG